LLVESLAGVGNALPELVQFEKLLEFALRLFLCDVSFGGEDEFTLSGAASGVCGGRLHNL